MREDRIEISLTKACDLAYNFLINNDYQKGFIGVYELPDKWIFRGRMFKGNFIEYGGNPISVSKKDGKIEWFPFSVVENHRAYLKSEDVKVDEKYLYH